MKKSILILSITFLIIIVSCSTIYATEGIIGTGQAWENLGENGSSGTTDTSKLNEASATLFNLFFDIGIGVVVVVGAFLGIKFMTAGVEEKAEVKETLMPYFISSIVLVGAYGIWKLLVVILGDLI